MILLDKIKQMNFESEFSKIPHIIAIYLFGSAAQQTMHASSDADFAILASDKIDPLALFDLKHSLSKHLRVDVDVVDLKRVSPIFGIEVLKSGFILYSKNEIETAKFENLLMSKYCFLNEERKDLVDDIVKRGSVRG